MNNKAADSASSTAFPRAESSAALSSNKAVLSSRAVAPRAVAVLVVQECIESGHSLSAVLPNSLKTEINMVCNVREWRHFFTLRCSPKAHPQMRDIAISMLEGFHDKIPVIFEDIYWEYISSKPGV